MMQMSVTIPLLDQQIRKFADFERIYLKHVKAMQQRNSMLMKVGWQAVAPRRTGLYMTSIMASVRQVSGEVHAVASTNVRSPGGFPYPRALEESTRYHYRSTGRRGQQTAGQVAKMFRGLRKQFDGEAQKTGDAIMKDLVVR